MAQFQTVKDFGTNFLGAVNGDQVIGFTSTQRIKDMGWVDNPLLSTIYKADPNKTHLGIVELFTNAAHETVPTLLNFLKKKDVLELDYGNQSFTYDIRVKKPTGCYTMKDTSTEHEFPGIDQSYFHIALSQKFEPGVQLTYDKEFGQAVNVSEDFEVFQEGDYWVHTVRLASLDKKEYFLKDKLRAGVQYFKVAHGLGEYSTQFDTIESPENTGTLTCEFILGNHRGVEVGWTMYADMKDFMGATTNSKDYWEQFQDDMGKIRDDMGRPLDMFFYGKFDKVSGKPKEKTSVGSTLEYLAILQNIKNEANQLMFGRAVLEKGINGTKRYNEGLYHQLRRGYTISYSRQITREHLRSAIEYVFQGTNIPIEKRHIRFDAGFHAYQNILDILSVEFNAQLTGLQFVMGGDRAIPNPISGTLDNLHLAPVTVTKVPVRGVGNVEVRHDPSMDYSVGADRTSRGFAGRGFTNASYSATVWDASSEEYSNARSGLPRGTKVIDPRRSGSNVFYVKPEGQNMWWGHENGRYDRTAGDIISSRPNMSRTFWVHNISAAWIRDVSRFVSIDRRPQ